MENIILNIKNDLKARYFDFKWSNKEVLYKIEERNVNILMADLKLIEKYFNYFLNKTLNEEVIDDIYRMTQLINWNKPLASACNEKDRNTFRAIQFLFSIYLRFNIPLNLWQVEAAHSWTLFRKYYSGAYENIESFEKENQQQWSACCNKLEEFRDHPKFGDKIKAKDSGYV